MCLLSLFHFFGEAIIGYFDVTIHIEQDVFWFEIPIGESHFVQIFDG